MRWQELFFFFALFLAISLHSLANKLISYVEECLSMHWVKEWDHSLIWFNATKFVLNAILQIEKKWYCVDDSGFYRWITIKSQPIDFIKWMTWKTEERIKKKCICTPSTQYKFIPIAQYASSIVRCIVRCYQSIVCTWAMLWRPTVIALSGAFISFRYVVCMIFIFSSYACSRFVRCCCCFALRSMFCFFSVLFLSTSLISFGR